MDLSTLNLFVGILCGASIAGAMGWAKVLDLKEQLRQQRQETIDQVNNCMALVESVEAQMDRDHYRKSQEIDWNTMIAPLFEVKQ